MSGLPGYVIAVDVAGALLAIAGIGIAFAPGARNVPRNEDPGRSARLIFGTMLTAFSLSIITLFTLFNLATASS